MAHYQTIRGTLVCGILAGDGETRGLCDVCEDCGAGATGGEAFAHHVTLGDEFYCGGVAASEPRCAGDWEVCQSCREVF